jgi:hypothetical protein
MPAGGLGHSWQNPNRIRVIRAYATALGTRVRKRPARRVSSMAIWSTRVIICTIWFDNWLGRMAAATGAESCGAGIAD